MFSCYGQFSPLYPPSPGSVFYNRAVYLCPIIKIIAFRFEFFDRAFYYTYIHTGIRYIHTFLSISMLSTACLCPTLLLFHYYTIILKQDVHFIACRHQKPSGKCQYDARHDMRAKSDAYQDVIYCIMYYLCVVVL